MTELELPQIILIFLLMIGGLIIYFSILATAQEMGKRSAIKETRVKK